MSGILSAFIGRVAGVVTDAYFNLVTLLLPGNGTNGAQNNTFLDSSSNNFTITRNGNTTQGTFSPFSQTGWSNYFSGSSPNDLTTPDSTAFEFTGDFTIEAFVYPTALGTYNAIIAHWQPGTAAGCSLVMSVNSSKRLVFAYGIGGTVASDVVGSSTTVELNTWSHVVVSRNSGTIRLFVNGTQDATTRTGATGTLNNSPNLIFIGSNTGADYFTGYISNLRVLGGTGVTSVTVPTAPLTDIANTILLTCQSNRFIDTNTQVAAKTITVNGSGVSVQAFSPFAPTAAYSAATVGGSGYFDETSDYLSAATNTAFNCGTGNWTIEAWVYITAESRTYPIIMGNNNGSYSAGALAFGNHNTDTGSYNNKFIITGYDSTLRFVDATTHPKNTWIHIAVVRDSTTTLKMFRDGVQVASTTISSGYTFDWGKGGLLIGGGNWDGVNSSFGGNIFNLRLIKGTAVYSGNFTPPTAPLSTSGAASASAYPSTTNVNTTFAASECSLLCNFTNAGITDATAKNDLETVGGAQISTTQSKFGGSSMYFDGTGDWLLGTPSVNNDFGTGNFTIEAWIYMTSTSNYFYIYNSSNANFNSPNFTFLYDTSLGLRMYAHAGTHTVNQGSTSGWSANTWYYVALVRNGGTITIYRDGVSLASGSTFSGVSFGSSTALTQIGGSSPDSRSNNGYIDDLRVTKGLARTITTPTTAFPVQ